MVPGQIKTKSRVKATAATREVILAARNFLIRTRRRSVGILVNAAGQVHFAAIANVASILRKIKFFCNFRNEIIGQTFPNRKRWLLSGGVPSFNPILIN